MHVPQHIHVKGDGRPEPIALMNPEQVAWEERERVSMSMHIPERILVAGGQGHAVPRAQPPEMEIDQRIERAEVRSMLNDMPLNIRLDKEAYPDIVPPEEPEPLNRQEESMSQASIAIEQDPIQEMKQMRRQLNRVIVRVRILEEDNDIHHNREWWYRILLAGLGLSLIGLFIRR